MAGEGKAQFGQDRNLEYQYDPNTNMYGKHVVMEEGDSLKIYFTVHIKRLEGQNARFFSLGRFSFRYFIFSDYREQVPLRGDSLYKIKPVFKGDKAQIWFSFKLPKPKETQAVLFLVVHDYELDESTQFDIPLVIRGQTTAQQWAIFNSKGKEPLFANYFTKKDTVVFRKLTDRFQKLIVFRYNYPFFPASPPHVFVPRPNADMPIDSTFSIYTDSPISFKKPAFYFVQEDSTKQEGFCFWVMDHKFPRITRAAEMVDPLAYITKEEEYEELMAASQPKPAVDDFWQNFGINDANGKKLIKLYYTKVEKANELFTTFKPGWKTDKGMVYILYGKPFKVIRSLEKEFWTYNINGSQLNFTFVRSPNIFYPNSYDLERESFYESSYIYMVQQWRKGIANK